MKARGWEVFATARNNDDIARLESEGLHACYLDYRDEASINRCLEFVLAKTGGRLDALFNNGAYGLVGAVEDIKTNDLREQFEANFFGWHELNRQTIPIMREQGHGRIIICSSVLGIVSGIHRAPYSATKHALEAFATSMRMELQPWNIQTISIRPGPIDTKFLETTFKVLNEKIDWQNSVYTDSYNKTMKRMNAGDKSSAFKLPPEAVFKKLVHACEASRPRAVYSVTTLTYLADIARRLLPTKTTDWFLEKGG